MHGAFLIVLYCSTCLAIERPAALKIRWYFHYCNRLCFQTKMSTADKGTKDSEQKHHSFSHPLVQTFEPTEQRARGQQPCAAGRERVREAFTGEKPITGDASS